MKRSLVAIATACACGRSGAPTATTGAVAASTGSGAAPDLSGVAVSDAWSCEPLAFAASTPVPEASAAAWMTIDDKLELVVVSDSGNHGAYALVDPETGATGEQGALPLGDASDDLEGVAARGGLLYGLTSGGWMRVWKRTGHAFALVDGPYAIGRVDPSLARQHATHETPVAGDAVACEQHAYNCGHDFERPALADPLPQAAGDRACIGFAAAKADGTLDCLVDQGGKVAIDLGRRIAVADPGKLADCTFGDDGALWTGTNMFDLNGIYRVDNWQDPAHAKVAKLAAAGVGNSEVIAVRGDVVYRMSDLNNAPSLMAKFRCHPTSR